VARKKKIVAPPPNIRETVEQWEGVSKFLRGLANNVAVVPNFSSEIVRACLIVATFLDDRAATVRNETPQAFVVKEEKTDVPVNKRKRA
jgi:hypothetical protein